MSLRPELLPTLAAFESAARHQNFAHAAEELHLTASAVSHHVRKLETRLGVMLFTRHARGVTLTAEGRKLADSTSSALSDMDSVLRELRQRDQAQTLLRISSLHSFIYAWLMPKLHRFSDLHPNVRMHMDTDVALARFEEGGVDLAIRHGPGHWPGLSAHLLVDETLFPVASPTMPGLDQVRTAADIAKLPLIADLARQGWSDWFRAAQVTHEKTQERYTFSDTTDALQAAASGMGAALARERIATPWLRDGSLIALPGPRIPARWHYYIVYPAHRRLRPVARQFVDWLLSVAREEVPREESHTGSRSRKRSSS